MDPLTAVVLAAGASSRLGRPKQLVMWRGETLVHRAARLALEAGVDSVRVVTGSHGEDVARAVTDLGVQCVHNPRTHEGLASSIQRGLEGLDTAVLLLTCDQPLLTAEHLRALVRHWREHRGPVVASTYEGIVGVPALFAAALLPELRALEGDQGARAVLRRHSAEALPLVDGGLDVDTEEDVRRLSLRDGPPG